MDRAHREAKGPEERKRPVAVALHEVIVHRHHVHLLALDDREITRKRRDDGLAFAGFHFSDAPFI
jgi:hypothetical protein